MPNITPIELAGLRIVRDDLGNVTSVIDKEGDDVGLVSAKKDLVTGVISFSGANGYPAFQNRVVAKKAPVPAIGGAGLSLSDVSIVSGTPTITLETGPNGQPALKVFIPANAGNAQISFPGLVGGYYYGEAYLITHGTRSIASSNFDISTVYVSQDDASYTNGVLQNKQYGYPTPLNNSNEQGGANTYFFRKSANTNIGTPTFPMLVGTMKVRIDPVNTTLPTALYIYGFGFSQPAKKGRICVIWDDGYDSMFKLGYDAFKSRDIKQTIALIGSVVDTPTYVSSRQLRGFVDAGNAIVAHGPWPAGGAGNLYTAYPGSLSPVKDAVADMVKNRDYISAQGLGVVNFDKCYVWPQGQFQSAVNDTTLLDAAVAAGFTTARSVAQVTALYPGGTNFDALGKYNRMALPILGHSFAGTTAAEATNIAAIVASINENAAAGVDCCLMLHRVQPTNTADGSMSNIAIRLGDLETIASAIKTNVDAGTQEAVTMPEISANSWWAQF